MAQNDAYDNETGLPLDRSYLECDLPEYILTAIDNMKKSWSLIDAGEKDLDWDNYWCELYSDINTAEVNDVISPEQAWYLREKYLRMRKEDNI